MSRHRSLAVLLAAAAAGLAGCGGGETGDGASATQRSGSPELAPTATPAATGSASPSPTPTGTPTDGTSTTPGTAAPPPDAGVPEGHGGEEQEGGGGDEEGARTPVDLVVDAEGVTPPKVEVAAFLAIEVTVRNDLPRPIQGRYEGSSSSGAFAVPARSSQTFRVSGQRDGSIAVDVGEAGRATIEVGAQPGP